MRDYFKKAFPDAATVDLFGFNEQVIRGTWGSYQRGEPLSNERMWDLIDFCQRNRMNEYVRNAASDSQSYMVRGVNIQPAVKWLLEHNVHHVAVGDIHLVLHTVYLTGDEIKTLSKPKDFVDAIFKEYMTLRYGYSL